MIVRAFNSGGVVQGYTVTSAFGASDATSTHVWYACAGVSSGRTSIGVWQSRTKSRETLYRSPGGRDKGCADTSRCFPWTRRAVRRETPWADVPADVLSGIRAVSQDIVSDPGYLTAMKPTGMEPWAVPFDKLQAAIDEDTKAFERDAKQFNMKLD